MPLEPGQNWKVAALRDVPYALSHSPVLSLKSHYNTDVTAVDQRIAIYF